MPQPITEVLPGVLHWAATHPNTGFDANSTLLVEEGVLIDPIAPPDEGLDWFEGRTINAIVLSNRHHTRSAFDIQERFGTPIRAPRSGMKDLPADKVEPYDFGDTIAGITTHGPISESWFDETALHIPKHSLVSICDAVHDYAGLGFFPDDLLGDDPDEEKRELKAGLVKLLDEIEFDNALFAHGAPIIGGAHEKLRTFVSR